MLITKIVAPPALFSARPADVFPEAACETMPKRSKQETEPQSLSPPDQDSDFEDESIPGDDEEEDDSNEEEEDVTEKVCFVVSCFTSDRRSIC